MKVHKVTEKLLHMTFDKASEAETLVTCERCGLTFNPGNTDAEARAEFERDFPGQKYDPKEIAILCTPCYEKFLEHHRGESLNN